jgi:hypothetical protein
VCEIVGIVGIVGIGEIVDIAHGRAESELEIRFLG